MICSAILNRNCSEANALSESKSKQHSISALVSLYIELLKRLAGLGRLPKSIFAAHCLTTREGASSPESGRQRNFHSPKRLNGKSAHKARGTQRVVCCTWECVQVRQSVSAKCQSSDV